MTTIHRYLVGRLFVSTSIIVVALCIPICFVALFKDVPTSLMYSKLIWPILYGIVPTAVYLTLPAAVAIACVWWYSALISDSVVAVLYAAGYSPRSVIIPAAIVALVASLLSGILTCVVAPHGTTKLYDILHAFAHNLKPSYLEPERFYKIDDGRRVLYFERWAGPDDIEGVFLREANEKEEEIIISAPRGHFVELEQEAILVLYDGVIQTFSRGDTESNTVRFDTLTKQTGLNGIELPKRGWVGMFELGPLAFLQAFEKARRDRLSLIHWTSEAIKRFGAPLLSISHTLLGVGLIMRAGAVRRRNTWWEEHSIYCLIMIIHLAVILAAEGALSLDVRIAWVIVAAMILELVAGILLVASSAFTRRPEFSSEHARDNAAACEAMAVQMTGAAQQRRSGP